MDTRATVELGVLGALRARATGVEVDIGPPQRRTVLAVLICGASQVIPTGRLLDCVWDDAASPSAIGSLHTHVSRLRKELGPDVIVRHPYGYALQLRPDQLDADVELGDTDVLGELEALVVEHPLHDGFCGRLMIALYRSGCQSDALSSARRHRRNVVEATGLAQAPWLTAIELRILRHDRCLMIPQRLQDDKKSTSEKQATDKPRTSDEGQDHRDHVREEHM
ncbi:MAG: BTAD domain-containing putative transcriptional regulator [Ilumatobacteraceae bacterium]